MPEDRQKLIELEHELAASFIRLDESAVLWLEARAIGGDTRTLDDRLDVERRFSRRVEKKVRRERKRHGLPV